MISARDAAKKINELERPVVIVGNGINMEDGSFRLSWKGLLRCLACKLTDETNKQILFELDKMLASSELSYTEVYDWLLLRIEQTIPDRNRTKGEMPTSKENIRNTVATLIQDNTVKDEVKDGHKKILEWCKHKNAPLLTTNYDNSFVPDAGWGNQSSNGRKIYAKRILGHNQATFPLSSYYLDRPIDENKTITEQFAIWHINGMVSKPKSIRLNLRDYMNFAHKIQNVTDGKSHYGKRYTWLEAFYNGDLVFAGLSLDSQEVVLRWMLIERRRRLLNINNNSTKAYYIKFNDGNEMSEEKRKFFDSLGIETLELEKGEKLSDVFAMINE